MAKVNMNSKGSMGGTAYNMRQLNDYVKGGERRVNAGTVLFDITHNYLKRNMIEIAMDTSWTIAYVKERCYQMTGSQIDTMELTLDGRPLDDDEKTLADYGCRTGRGGTIHIKDNDPFSNAKGGALEDVSLVEKYVMTDEDYDKRDNTYRAYKKKMLAKDPNWKPVKTMNGRDGVLGREEEKKVEPLQTLEEVLETIKVGERCEVLGGRRGEVMYVGPVKEIQGREGQIWVGVKYDEAVGKHDGMVMGKRYFTAGPKCGGFVKPALIKCGDFPELDPFDDLSGSDDDKKEEAKEQDDDEDLMEEL